MIWREHVGWILVGMVEMEVILGRGWDIASVLLVLLWRKNVVWIMGLIMIGRT